MNRANGKHRERSSARFTHLIWWITTLAWAGLIFDLSTQGFGPSFTEKLLAWTLNFLHLHLSWRTFDLLHTLIRKLAHLTEYSIFALLLYEYPGEGDRPMWRRGRALLSVLGAGAYSLTDEFHQIFSPGRHASLWDCGLDTLGAALAMLVPYTLGLIFRRRPEEPLD